MKYNYGSSDKAETIEICIVKEFTLSVNTKNVYPHRKIIFQFRHKKIKKHFHHFYQKKNKKIAKNIRSRRRTEEEAQHSLRSGDGIVAPLSNSS